MSSFPADWYWTTAPAGSVPAQVWSSKATAWVTEWDPDALTRIRSELELADVLRQHGLVAPSVNADDVRAEASRRLQVIVGARDAEHLLIIQMKAHEEAIELLDKLNAGEVLTAAQKAHVAELRTMRVVFQEIRDASNALEGNPPADYRDDKYWTLGGQVNTSSGWFSGIWGYITSKLTGG